MNQLFFWKSVCNPESGAAQVEVSGGRGKPSTIVDKDEGLGKVNYFINISILTSLAATWSHNLSQAFYF